MTVLCSCVCGTLRTNHVSSRGWSTCARLLSPTVPVVRAVRLRQTSDAAAVACRLTASAVFRRWRRVPAFSDGQSGRRRSRAGSHARTRRRAADSADDDSVSDATLRRHDGRRRTCTRLGGEQEFDGKRRRQLDAGKTFEHRRVETESAAVRSPVRRAMTDEQRLPLSPVTVSCCPKLLHRKNTRNIRIIVLPADHS